MEWIRLYFIVEGATEEKFVKNILHPHLVTKQIEVKVSMVSTKATGSRINKGGLVNYERAKKDIIKWLKSDPNPDAYFTTMFDLYALPNNFPEKNKVIKFKDPYKKVEFLEQNFYDNIYLETNDRRFIPYIQLQEFETFLFVQPELLADTFFEEKNKTDKFKLILKNNQDNPELIDEGRTTAPSKRIIALYPKYQYKKADIAPLITQKIGIEALRKNCRHFNDWITKLENLCPNA